MDAVRLLLWYGYLQTKTLGFVNYLGFYYVVLCLFGLFTKLVGGVFAILLYRQIVRRSRERLILSSRRDGGGGGDRGRGSSDSLSLIQ